MLLKELLTFFPILSAGAYLVLLVVLFVRRNEGQPVVYWSLGFLATSTLWQALLYIFPTADGYYAPLPLHVLVFGTLLFLFATAAYINSSAPRWWLVVGLLIILTAAVLDIVLPAKIIELPKTIRLLTYPSLGGVISSAVGILLSLVTYLLTLRAYHNTRFPWHANRYLYWANIILLKVIGETLIFFASPLLFLAGQLLRYIAAAGLVYAASSYISFDVRTRFRRGLAFVIIALLSALPATLVFLIFISFRQRYSLAFTAAAFILVASVAFLLYLPYRRLVEKIIYRYLVGTEFHTNKIIRDYNKEISAIVDIEHLSTAVIGTLNTLFGTSRGALFLVSQTPTGYEVEPIPALGQIPRATHILAAESPFINALINRHQPLSKYEIDFNPDLRAVRREVGEWLNSHEMDIYVPILAGNQLTGFIALGPKNSGYIYRPNELDVAQLLADQSVVALQNARLYTELGEQNEKVRHLNEGLLHQNERLEVMDKVKSDFITIASHELRTPLTQVKGYADILAAMNEENALTREQTRQIVGHINRATGQLEELITAMLDASQIDVDEMQMTFTKTDVSTVIRLAMEPLTRAMRERRIAVAIDGVNRLPEIYSDFKRLVQCFTNLIGNALKYTPDGGKITITADTIDGGDDEQYVQIAITDTGIGIDIQYHQLIFEKFFRVGDPQLHSTGSTKFLGAGPGLGLPIAKGVVEGHGGRIWVESEGEDQQRMPGSTFTVILPVRPPKMPNLPALKDLEKSERPAWLVG